MKILLIMASFLFTSISFAELPYVLKNGDVVDAPQLNEMFNYLDGNKISVYANGVEIGKTSYTSFDVSGDNKMNPSLSVKIKDYTISIDNTGKLPESPIHYKSSDCTGQEYIKAYSFNPKSFYFPPGKMSVFDNDSQLYYYPKHAQLYKITSNSTKLLGTCSVVSDSTYVYIMLLNNDPAITGILIYPFPLPITIDGVVESVIVE